MPIKLHIVPDDLQKIKIDDSGMVSVFNDKTRKLEAVARVGVVDARGTMVEDPNVKQGYNEYSNVALQNEFIEMMPVIRNFEANRQVFLIQNQNLQKVINQMPNNGALKAQTILEINENHDIAKKLKELYNNDKETLKKYTKVLYSQARLIEGLSVENPTEISNLVCEIMAK